MVSENIYTIFNNYLKYNHSKNIINIYTHCIYFFYFNFFLLRSASAKVSYITFIHPGFAIAANQQLLLPE